MFDRTRDLLHLIKFNIARRLDVLGLFGNSDRSTFTEDEIKGMLSIEAEPVNIDDVEYFLLKFKEMVDTGHFSFYLRTSSNTYDEREIYLDSWGYKVNGKDEIIDVDIFLVTDQDQAQADDIEWKFS